MHQDRLRGHLCLDLRQVCRGRWPKQQSLHIRTGHDARANSPSGAGLHHIRALQS